MIKRFIREPLVHFVFLGGLVFAAYALVNNGRLNEKMTIHVSESDIDRLIALYKVESGTEPSQRLIEGLIQDYILDMVLVREARSLGLDQGDIVIQRRLSQIMNFMISDMYENPTPTEAELSNWYRQNKKQFVEPEKFSFRHIFFAKQDDSKIENALNRLRTPPSASEVKVEESIGPASDQSNNWRKLGEPFMLQREYSNLPTLEIHRIFGNDFTQQLTELMSNLNEWQGPIESAVGVHLVQPIAHKLAYQPTLNEVRSKVIAAWQEHIQQTRTQKALNAIVGKYTVIIDGEISY